MTNHYLLQREDPAAIITVNGNEKKIYKGNIVYLNDGDNFAIRLFNSLSEQIGVEINLNGIKKTNSLLVLKPGQDYTLDRFIEENKKMLFSTYEVSGDSEMVKKAIENNGYVDIKFYKEKKAPVVYYNNTGNYRGRCIYDNFNNFNTTVGTADTIGTFTSSSTPTFKSSNTPIDSLYNSNIEYLSEELDVKKPKQRMSKLKACKVETGRVEMGDYSNQNFKQISVEFETLPFYIVEYKLLPISSKNYETTEIRNYCPKCSYRIRKQSWLYCPKCSEKL